MFGVWTNQPSFVHKVIYGSGLLAHPMSAKPREKQYGSWMPGWGLQVRQ